MASSRQIKERKALLDAMGLGAPRFRCDICSKDFSSAAALIAHGQKAHGR